MTEHLAQFGAQEIPRAEYRRRLASAIEQEGDFYRLPPSAAGAEVMSAISPER
jgi:leucyl/phenylalanyl-tRNA--protein transferase